MYVLYVFEVVRELWLEGTSCLVLSGQVMRCIAKLDRVGLGLVWSGRENSSSALEALLLH